jgi:hypothetical protein
LRCVVPPTEECDIPATPAPEQEQQSESEGRAQVIRNIFIITLFLEIQY